MHNFLIYDKLPEDPFFFLLWGQGWLDGPVTTLYLEDPRTWSNALYLLSWKFNTFWTRAMHFHFSLAPKLCRLSRVEGWCVAYFTCQSDPVDSINITHLALIKVWVWNDHVPHPEFLLFPFLSFFSNDGKMLGVGLFTSLWSDEMLNTED